jgi:GNAT superfamily N-acetyltransferase
MPAACLYDHRVPIVIRPATAADAGFLARGNIAMALEAEHKTLDAAIVGAGVRAVLDDPGKGVYFVAELDQRVVGQLMITYEWSDWRNGNFWWIQSVYVLPEARRKGVFQSLFAHLARTARDAGDVCGIRLYVDRGNARAQATYRRCGLEDAGYAVMEVDYSNAVQAAGGGDDARQR